MPGEHEPTALAGARLVARAVEQLLSTPLTVALGYAELLADPRLPEDLLPWMQEVRRSVVRAA